MTRCTEPKMPGDVRYVHGARCTWHGPIRWADQRVLAVDTTSYGDVEPSSYDALLPCCPHCAGELVQWPSGHAFQDELAKRDRVQPGTKRILDWGQGRCFPDFETLENAWRQAMEGQE